MRPFDAAGKFQGLHTNGELRQLAIRGAGATLFASSAGFCLQVVSTVVLARLLAPSDFGLVAMVTTFSLLIGNFGLNGFTEAIQQQEDITAQLVSNLFWINLSVASFLTVIFFASGWALARFYHDPRVASVTAALSLSIFLGSLSVIHLAILKRAMRFGAVSFNDIVARCVSLALSITLACLGWGVWALVAGTLSLPAVAAVGAWAQCRWLPGRPRRTRGTASALRFALHVYARFSFNYVARNLDNVLVGWKFGASTLGFYKKAYDLFLLSASQISTPLTSVAVSALSRLKAQPSDYRQHITRIVSVIAFVGMAVGTALTLIGRDLVRIVLGPRWAPVGTIFLLFGPGIGIMLVYNMHGWIHISIGRPERWFRWSILEFVITALLFVLCLPWGAAGVAFAWTLSFWVLFVPAFWYAGRPIGLSVSAVLAAIWKFVAAALASGIASFEIIRAVPSFATLSSVPAVLLRMCVTLALCGALYTTAVVLLERGWSSYRQLAKLAAGMVPWRTSRSWQRGTEDKYSRITAVPDRVSPY